MLPSIESLESRRFLSATPTAFQSASAVVLDDLKMLTANIRQCQKLSSQSLQSLAPTLRKGGRTDRELLASLSAAYRTSLAALSRNQSRATALVHRDVQRLTSDVRALQRKPTDAPATARLNADVAALQTDAAEMSVLTSGGNLESTVGSQLTAVAGAIGSSAALTTAQINLNVCGSAINRDVMNLRAHAASLANAAKTS